MLTKSKPCEIILTVNHRLAAHLINQYDRLQIQERKEAWNSPSVFSIDQWLKSLWLENTEDSRFLLTPYAESVLWDRVIQPLIQSRFFVQQNQLVPSISEAYQFLNQWDIPVSHLKKYVGHEAAHFLSLCIES